MQPKMITLKETAEMIGRSPNTIRNWIRGTYTRDGKTHACKVKFAPAYKVGGGYLFREVDVSRWLEAQKCQTNAAPC